MMAEKMAGAESDTIDGAFEDSGGLEGVVEDNMDNFDTEPDVDAIRELVEEYTDGL